MRKVDLVPLVNSDQEYEKAYTDVADKYKCNWDDSVHDSYSSLVKDIEEYSNSIHRIRCKTETMSEEIEALNVDNMLDIADSLCKEAVSV